MTPRKTYILDTSVLLAYGPKALYSFDNAEVVIPIVVVKELESKKGDPTLGYMARSVLREFEKYRVKLGHQMTTIGADLENGAHLRFELNNISRDGLPDSLVGQTSHDVVIMTVANNLNTEAQKREGSVTLVSQDLAMRLKAQMCLNLDVEEFVLEDFEDSRIPSGVTTIDMSDDELEQFAMLDDDEFMDAVESMRESTDPIPNNTAVLVKDQVTGRAVSAGLVDTYGEHQRLVKLPNHLTAGSMCAKSIEQRIALHHLQNQDIDIVSLGGAAGTGKTSLAIAAGVDALNNGDVDQIMVFRSMHSVGGQELGFLPGDENEKMAPWAAAAYDALSASVSGDKLAELKESDKFQVLPLTHLRGRTISRTWIVIDEAQNLEHSVLLTVLSRMGRGSKAVLSWDADQRDNTFLGKYNGIVSVVKKLQGEPLFAHITLTQCERSRAARMVTSRLA